MVRADVMCTQCDKPRMRRATARQLHGIVPTSSTPPIPEWAGHYWYVLRCGALQAHAELADPAALVAWFHGFTVTTPCPECRAHYTADWATLPFTEDHAKDPVVAMKWVEDLRGRIEDRKRAAAVPKAVAPPAPPRSSTAATSSTLQRLAIKSAMLRARDPGTGCKNCRRK
jgi:hypothetical protein